MFDFRSRVEHELCCFAFFYGFELRSSEKFKKVSKVKGILENGR